MRNVSFGAVRFGRALYGTALYGAALSGAVLYALLFLAPFFMYGATPCDAKITSALTHFGVTLFVRVK